MKKFIGIAVITTALTVVGCSAFPTGTGSNAAPAAVVPASQSAGGVTASQAVAPGNVITVSGYGQAFGAPDIATVELGVDITSAEVGRAVEQGNQVIEDITAALSALDIDPADIQTVNFNVWQEDRFNPETGAQTGERVFHVQNTIRVRVRNIDDISTVIDTGLSNGANQVWGLYFSIADTSELESTAREQAVADARARAEELAAALGVTLGDPVGISEGVSGGGPFPAGVDMEQAGFGGGGPSISQGQLSVGVSVTVSYALNQ